MTNLPEDTMGDDFPGSGSRARSRAAKRSRRKYGSGQNRQPVGLPSTSTGAMSLQQASRPGSSLATGYLGLGAAMLGGIQAIVLLLLFAVRWHTLVTPWPTVAAWTLFVVGAGVITGVVFKYGERLTWPVFALVCAILGCVAALDFIGIWANHDTAHTATASIAAAYALLPISTLRPARDVGAAITVLGVAFATVTALSSPLTAATLPAQLDVLTLVVVPPAVAVYIVRHFRQIVQRELDRALVQSTVTAPQFAVGMLASDELARLDLAAEEFLESVADSVEPLPLSPDAASVPAQLATELRLHLIEGRRETWLYHAITESDYLGRAVSVADPESLAGRLSRTQRDGLLQAIWQMAGDGRSIQAGVPVVAVTFGPVGAEGHPVSDDTIDVPIFIESRGVPRRRLGSATWQALGRVGEYTDSLRGGLLQVEAHCIVNRHPPM